MSEGLEWMLDVDAKTEGPAALLSKLDQLDATLRKIDGKLGATTKASTMAGEAHRKHAHDADGLGHAIQGATHHFEKMVEVVAEWKIAEKLVDLPAKIFELGEEMLRTAAKAERTEKSFGMVFGKAGSEEMLADIEKIGKATEFSHERLEQLTGSLGKVGFDGQGLKEARALALDIAALSGNKEEGLGSAESAIERIMLSGQVSMRTLMGAGISKKSFMEELASRTGKGTKELEKEMTAGTIKADVLMRSLEAVVTKKTGKALGGATHEMSSNVDATLEHLGELPERYFKKMSKSAAFGDLEKALGGVLEQLDPESPRGKRIFSALEGAVDGIAGALKSIDLAGILEGGLEVLERFETGFLRFLSMMPGETGNKAGVELANITRRQDERARKLAEDNEFEHRGQEHGTTGAFERAASTAKTNYAETGKQAAAGYAGGLSDNERIAVEGAYEVSDKSLEAMRDGLGIHSPSTEFMKLGEYSAEGFDLGLRKGRDTSPVVPLLSQRGAAAAAGGGATITVAPVLHLHFGGGGQVDESNARAAGQTVADVTVSALESAIDSLGIQAGS